MWWYLAVLRSFFYSTFYTHPAVSSQEHLHIISLGGMSYQNQLMYGTQLRSVAHYIYIYISSYLTLLEQHLAGAIFPSMQNNCRYLMIASTTVIVQHTNHQVPLCLLFLSSTLHVYYRHSILLSKLLKTTHITLFKVSTLINLAQFFFTRQPHRHSKRNLKTVIAISISRVPSRAQTHTHHTNTHTTHTYTYTRHTHTHTKSSCLRLFKSAHTAALTLVEDHDSSPLYNVILTVLLVGIHGNTTFSFS
jgi:hypothetical protein